MKDDLNDNLESLLQDYKDDVKTLQHRLKSYIRKAMSLSQLDYVIVKNSFSGAIRVERGPQLLFLRPFDAVEGAKRQVSGR